MRTGFIRLPRTHGYRNAWLVLLVLLASGCEPERFSRPQPVPEQAAEQGARFSAEGRHGAAAAVYLELARQGTPDSATRYRLLATREYRLAGQLDLARRLLDGISRPVADTNRLLLAQVSAELSLSLGDPGQALRDLDQAPAARGPDMAARLLLIRGEALFRLDRPAAAVAALMEREAWLPDPSSIAENHRIIWRGLQNWGAGVSPESWQGIRNRVQQGWLQLAYAAWPVRTDPTALRAALMDWQARHPDHPANRGLLREILADLTTLLNYPRRVALLLPLSGRLQQTGEAIRVGFLAAHFAVEYLPVRPEIMIYDVQQLGPAATYDQAILDGADFVVGPLTKDAVREVAAVAGAATTLALNFLPDDTPTAGRFYQFSLSPEDEARQAAQRAMAAGQFRAIALAPGNSWGQRLLNSFAAELEQGGGKLLDYRYYDPQAPHFSDDIQSLLLIDESKARHRRLQANLGRKLGFEPRLREDLDLIFLAARADAGLAIRPLLRFYFAGDIPTYATSAIYRQESRDNSDLNGVIFPDIPWILDPDSTTTALKQTISHYWPAQAVRHSRLYAMGYDAYRLMPLLYGRNRFGRRAIAGVTGRLFLDRDGRIHRRLPWTRMVRGRPMLLEEPDDPLGESGLVTLSPTPQEPAGGQP